MGFGNMFKKVMQMRGNASGVGQLGKRLMKDGGPTASAASNPNKKAKGGCVKMAKGGSVSSRADGVAQRGKTKGRMV